MPDDRNETDENETDENETENEGVEEDEVTDEDKGEEDEEEILDLESDLSDDDILDEALKEGIEDDEKEDKDDEEIDPEGEEDETDENEDDDEEALADILGLPDELEEEESDDEEKEDEFTDEDLLLEASKHSTWSSWMDANPDEGDIDQAFVAQMIRERVSPQWLEENGIYSIKDIVKLTEGMQARVDEDAIFLPQDEEGKKETLRKYFGVPDEARDYEDDSFKGTIFEEDNDVQEEEREWAHNIGLTQSQFEGYLERIEGVHKDVINEEIEELMKYKEAQAKEISTAYGDDAPHITKEASKLLRQYGPEFMKEFEGQKVLKSKAFVDLLYRIIETGTPLKNISLNDFTRSVNKISDAKLQEFQTKLIKHPKYQDKHRGTKAYATLHKQYKKVYNELLRRGLEG